MKPVDIPKSTDVDTVHYNLQAVDTDVLVIGLGEGPLIQKNMGEWTLIPDLLNKYTVPEIQGSIAAEINRSCNPINPWLRNDDGTTLIYCGLEGLCVIDATCSRREAVGGGIGKVVSPRS